MILLDNFLFNGEEAAFCRLEYLYHTVDKFYICEKKYTYQGAEKELYIESMKDRFAPYLDKIVFIIDDSPVLESAWENEYVHRNFSVTKILEDYPEEKFLLSVCDCDEFPDAELLKSEKNNLYELCSNGSIKMQQQSYYYNLNWLAEIIQAAFFLNDTLLKTHKSFQLFRNSKGPISTIIQCGWHFSYFMLKDEIIRKIESFAHTEYNTEEYKSEITECIAHGQDLFKRGWHPLTRNLDKNFPKVILDFHKKIITSQFR